jgi:ribonuclease BN (tRNA processing enzyme)
VPPAPVGPKLSLDSPDAGAVAAVAGVRTLLLTHFWPGNDRERSRADGAASSAGEIHIADEGVVIPLR